MSNIERKRLIHRSMITKSIAEEEEECAGERERKKEMVNGLLLHIHKFLLIFSRRIDLKIIA